MFSTSNKVIYVVFVDHQGQTPCMRDIEYYFKSGDKANTYCDIMNDILEKNKVTNRKYRFTSIKFYNLPDDVKLEKDNQPVTVDLKQ